MLVLARQELRRFPVLEPASGWTPDAVQETVQSFFAAKGKAVTAAVLAQARDAGSMARTLRRSVRNFLISEARKTPAGAVRRKIEDLLAGCGTSLRCLPGRPVPGGGISLAAGPCQGLAIFAPWWTRHIACLACVRCADMGSRRILGHALGERHDTELAYGALAMAAAVRGGRTAGVIFHSDQGSEYTAARFRSACGRLGVRQSMGRPGPALDNAVIESWHSTLEWELRSLRKFATRAEARAAIAAWIEDYHHERGHSALGMRSPVDYERSLAGKDAA